MRSRKLGVFVLVASFCSLVIASFLALRTPGDISIRDDCQRSSLSLYRDPQPEGELEPVSDLDVGALCNAEARRGVEAAMFYLVGGCVGGVYATFVLTRGRGDAGRRYLGAAIGMLLTATTLVIVVYDRG